MSRVQSECVDPVVSVPFQIALSDSVATAGSCFAQHISRSLQARGFRYLVTEPGPVARSYHVFSARFGNIYTVRQLLQLFLRAYGHFEPLDGFWRQGEAWVDPFRPQVEPDGFPNPEALTADRERHLAAVRRMFEECDVFIFTLGLTEGWLSTGDGAVFPLAPGVAGTPGQTEGYAFCNFSVAQMVEDFTRFTQRFRTVNPKVRIILTVSPIPLMATYEDRHVLLSTVYSKSALRVVAEMLTQSLPDIAYFPSYEIITGHHTRYSYFDDDLRHISPEGIARVMTVFERHYLDYENTEKTAKPEFGVNEAKSLLTDAERVALSEVICDEEILGQ